MIRTKSGCRCRRKRMKRIKIRNAMLHFELI